MISKDQYTAKNVLLEASLKRIALIESMDYPEINTDESYNNKIYDAIYNTSNKKHYTKKITLILVASITICFLILFSISAQVRTKVIDFFVEVYETFASFFIEKDNIQTVDSIETKYQPKCLKSLGYTENIQIDTKRYINYIWTNEKVYIGFSQYIIDENSISLDAEDTEYEIFYIGDQKVFCKTKDNKCSLKWLAYGYSFNLSCDKDFSWEEIEKIILSLEPVSE